MEVEEQGGSFHGVVTDVLQNTAQDIFEVKRDEDVYKRQAYGIRRIVRKTAECL